MEPCPGNLGREAVLLPLLPPRRFLRGVETASSAATPSEPLSKKSRRVSCGPRAFASSLDTLLPPTTRLSVVGNDATPTRF